MVYNNFNNYNNNKSCYTSICTNSANCNYNQYKYNLTNQQFGEKDTFPNNHDSHYETMIKKDNVLCYTQPIYYTGVGTNKLTTQGKGATFRINPSPETIKLFQEVFTENVINTISRKITDLLQGVDPKGRDIVVSPENICGILSAVSDNFFNVGDIGGINTVFQIPTQNGNISNKDKVILRVINLIVSFIRDDTARIECNKSLTVWTSVYGDFNEHGLRAHPPLKTKVNDVNKAEFHMRY